MKNHIIISLLFLSVGLSQQEYNNNDLIEMDNGLWSVKFSDEPITGKIYGHYGEGSNLKKVYVGNIVNGKKEVKWVGYYHSTGKKIYEEYYKDGKRDGLWTWWYENGEKRTEGDFKDGGRDGLFTQWYENGQKRTEGNFKDGKEDGLVTDWYENGQKKFEWNFKDGDLVKLKGRWNEDGSVME